MNISINEEILNKYNLSINEFLVLYLCMNNADIKQLIQQLIDKEFVDRDIYNNISAVVSDNIKNIISAILIESDKKVINSDNDFIQIANKMRELFPSGRKSGTTYQWRDSTAIIANKLKTIVAKFNFKFTEEEALNATKQYIDSFNGNYTYMQLLKYFILKTDRKTGELRSDFMSLIENKNQESINQDWDIELK